MSTVVLPCSSVPFIDSPANVLRDMRIKLLPWAFGENRPKRENWSLSREEIAALTDEQYYMLTKGRHLSP